MSAVLVVDDEAAVRSSSADILRAAGYEVAEASDGLEALDVLRTQPVDAVVLDVRMPRCDGISMVAALEHPPPIVMVSAHAVEQEDLDRLSGKVGVFLIKPVPPPRLLEQVHLAVHGTHP